jgi:microcystin-dependent protein
MSEPFLGEVRVISWNFPPKGWAFGNGQLLQIDQNQALFAILGTARGAVARTSSRYGSRARLPSPISRPPDQPLASVRA